VRIKPSYLQFGCDPEGFFEKDGVIIGSEKIIPPDGIGGPHSPTVVRDGVQFELHPIQNTSPYGLSSTLRRGFRQLNDCLKANPGVKANFNTLVEVSREELDSLSEGSRLLGCQPSLNIYGVKPIDVDPKEYRKRSAGGHIHLGLGGTAIMSLGNTEDLRHRLIPHLDIFVGNTCVLLDRDPGAKERRENYGRAGEYRLPIYGVEYRTLSNFWLRSYQLFDFVMGMSRLAVAVLDDSLRGGSFEQELVDTIQIDDFIDAINTNDFDLAMKNFETITPFLMKSLPEWVTVFPLTPQVVYKFRMFAEGVKEKGLSHFFPQEPVEHWCDGTVNPKDFQDFLRLL
jgi:hypothetical protein